jgi:hypothetical protein
MLGFEEATHLLEDALAVHETAHPAAFAARIELLLALALSRARCGHEASAKRACVDAASMARALGDAAALGRCALAYGAVPTIGRTDVVLVQLIDEALAALTPDQSNSALTSRLLARKAAALQPAADPRLPLHIARDAVARVEHVGDDRAQLEVLGTAVSALVSFTDGAERIALNRRALALAEKLGEPIAVLRAHQRLVLDHLEVGDVTASKQHAAAYAQAAARFTQPHLSWQVPMFAACHALLEGRFTDHTRHTADARVIIDRLDDRSHIASICFEMHTLAAARDADDPALLARQAGDLEERVSTWTLAALAMPIAAGFAATLQGDQRAAHAALKRADVFDIVRLGDIPMIGAWAAETAAFVGEKSWARALYDWYAAMPRGRALVWNLHGMAVAGPIDRLLFLLARALDLAPAAQQTHLAAARALCERMGARPLLARLHAESAESADSARTRSFRGLSTSSRASAPATITMERDGDRWTVRGLGASGVIKSSRGVEMLARLVAEPGRELKALVLAAGDDAEASALDGDAGEHIDGEARDAYRQRLRELRGEIEEADEGGDLARKERLLTEAEALDKELRRAVGLGGRLRKASAASERARSNVQRRLTDAIKRIAAVDEALGAHLTRTVRTGNICSYLPSRAEER